MAAVGRVNARGIPVFYGATDRNVALAEVRPPVGSKVVVAQFDIIRPLQLLDAEALRSLSVDGSVFDPQDLPRKQKAAFLNGLSEEITKPVMPDDEILNYIPTQTHPAASGSTGLSDTAPAWPEPAATARSPAYAHGPETPTLAQSPLPRPGRSASQIMWYFTSRTECAFLRYSTFHPVSSTDAESSPPQGGGFRPGDGD